jgi:hypothetical protein
MATRTWTGANDDHKPDVAADYLEAAVPTDADDAYFRARALVDGVTTGDVGVTVDVADLAAVLLASLHIEQSFTGALGTAIAPFSIGAIIVHIGEDTGFGSPAGSPRINLDLPALASPPVITVFDTAETSTEELLPPVRILAHDEDAVLYVRRGTVGVGMLGEAAQFSAINVSFVDNQDGDANVHIGPNVTVATINKTGGQMTLASAATTINHSAGTLIIEGTGAITNLTVTGGTVICNSTGTITNLNCQGGTVDFTRSQAARTVTTPKIWAGATLKYDPAVVAMTAKPAAQEAVSLQASAA